MTRFLMSAAAIVISCAAATAAPRFEQEFQGHWCEDVVGTNSVKADGYASTVIYIPHPASCALTEFAGRSLRVTATELRFDRVTYRLTQVGPNKLDRYSTRCNSKAKPNVVYGINFNADDELEVTTLN
jgi:hypothetical protein